MTLAPLRYAGFWLRTASIFLDGIILIPMIVLHSWGRNSFRLFDVFSFLPILIFNLFWSVYLVRRYGGTPGKLIAGIRIRKVDGGAVGYREAILRCLPDYVLWIVMAIIRMIPLFYMTDADYFSLTSTARFERTTSFFPYVYSSLRICENIWIWSELVVLLLNEKRRALHDYVAGTVVVYASPESKPESVENAT